MAVIANQELAYSELAKSLLGTSLQAKFPLWDAASPMTDISGNGRNGVYTGTPVYGATGIGDGRTSVNFNAAGLGNAFSAGLAGALNPNAFFLDVWLSVNNIASWTDGAIHNCFFMAADGSNYYQLRVAADGTLAFISRRGGTVKTVTVDAPKTTRWLHVALVGDTANDKVYAFLNGARARAVTTLGTWTGSFANNWMNIGHGGGDVVPGANTFPGRMAHCDIANAIPSDSVVARLAQRRGVIAFEGDSRTLNKNWDTAAVELAFSDGLFAYGGYGVANYAVTGSGFSDGLPDTAEIDSATRIADVNALLGTGNGNNVLVVWCGVNDVAGMTAQQIYDALRAYCIAQRAAGWNKIIVCSEIDAQANMTWHNTTYPALNVLLRADHTFADGFVDLGNDVRLQNALDTTYYNADKIHLVTAGYNVVRDLVYPVLASVA